MLGTPFSILGGWLFNAISLSAVQESYLALDEWETAIKISVGVTSAG